MIMTNYFDPGTGDFLVVDGNIVERDALRIAEAINDYDPNLTLLCVDPAQADFNEAPFLVCERKHDGTLVRVLEAWELDDRILERIYNSDTRRTDVLANLMRKESQLERERENRYQERREANMDLVSSVAANRKSKFSFTKENGDLVTFYDNKPTEVKRAE